MTHYECTACTNDDDGTFTFSVMYSYKPPKGVEATRCPRCGTLVDTKDVKVIE